MNHQFEGFLADIARHGSEIRAAERYNALLEDFYEKEAYLARCYAIRSALEQELKKWDPRNPLLVDASLRTRIGEAAVSAFFNNPDPDGRRNYGRAREVGETFRIPRSHG